MRALIREEPDFSQTRENGVAFGVIDRDRPSTVTERRRRRHVRLRAHAPRLTMRDAGGPATVHDSK